MLNVQEKTLSLYLNSEMREFFKCVTLSYDGTSVEGTHMPPATYIGLNILNLSVYQCNSRALFEEDKSGEYFFVYNELYSSAKNINYLRLLYETAKENSAINLIVMPDSKFVPRNEEGDFWYLLLSEETIATGRAIGKINDRDELYLVLEVPVTDKVIREIYSAYLNCALNMLRNMPNVIDGDFDIWNGSDVLTNVYNGLMQSKCYDTLSKQMDEWALVNINASAYLLFNNGSIISGITYKDIQLKENGFLARKLNKSSIRIITINAVRRNWLNASTSSLGMRLVGKTLTENGSIDCYLLVGQNDLNTAHREITGNEPISLTMDLEIPIRVNNSLALYKIVAEKCNV